MTFPDSPTARHSTHLLGLSSQVAVPRPLIGHHCLWICARCSSLDSSPLLCRGLPQPSSGLAQFPSLSSSVQGCPQWRVQHLITHPLILFLSLGGVLNVLLNGPTRPERCEGPCYLGHQWQEAGWTTATQERYVTRFDLDGKQDLAIFSRRAFILSKYVLNLTCIILLKFSPWKVSGSNSSSKTIYLPPYPHLASRYASGCRARISYTSS